MIVKKVKSEDLKFRVMAFTDEFSFRVSTNHYQFLNVTGQK